jgi:hypothetical protein
MDKKSDKLFRLKSCKGSLVAGMRLLHPNMKSEQVNKGLIFTIYKQNLKLYDAN